VSKDVVIKDDISGDPGAETHRIALDNRVVRIDLTKANYDKLAKLLAPYFENGREQGHSDNNKPEGLNYADVRAWAKSRRIRLSDRGRIPQDVIDRYLAEQQSGQST